MTWGRIDDGYWEHPKTKAKVDEGDFGLRALGAFWVIHSYCLRNRRPTFKVREAAMLLNCDQDHATEILEQLCFTEEFSDPDFCPEQGFEHGFLLRGHRPDEYEIYNFVKYLGKNEARAIAGRKGGEQSGRSRRQKSEAKSKQPDILLRSKAQNGVNFASKQTRSRGEFCFEANAKQPDILLRSKREANSPEVVKSSEESATYCDSKIEANAKQPDFLLQSQVEAGVNFASKQTRTPDPDPDPDPDPEEEEAKANSVPKPAPEAPVETEPPETDRSGVAIVPLRVVRASSSAASPSASSVRCRGDPAPASLPRAQCRGDPIPPSPPKARCRGDPVTASPQVPRCRGSPAQSPPQAVWCRGSPVTTPRELILLLQSSGAYVGSDGGLDLRRNAAKLKQALSAGPIPSEDYEPVLAQIASEGSTPNVGFFLSILKRMREQSAQSFEGQFPQHQEVLDPWRYKKRFN